MKVAEENGVFGRAKLTKRNIGICSRQSYSMNTRRRTCIRTSLCTLHITIIKLSRHISAYAAKEFEVLCVVPDPQVSDNSKSRRNDFRESEGVESSGNSRTHLHSLAH